MVGGPDFRIWRLIMRALVVPVLAILASIASQGAFAQGAPPAKDSAKDTVRYFTFDAGLMDDLQVDGILTETRQGGRVISAVLDVCYPGAEGSDKQDRFVLTLTPDKGKLVGAGKSQEDKEQVTVSITRKQTGTTYSFEGTIKVGPDQMKVASTENTDMSDKEFREAQAEDTINPAPADFTVVSPGTIGIKVKRESLGALIKGLKGEDAAIDFGGLEVVCSVLRAGQHVVQVQVHPERAAAFIQKVKGMPGVTAVGYTTGTYVMDSAVRVAAADFRKDGKIDYEKLAAAVGVSAEKSLKAKLRSTSWDKTTGEFTLELTRPDESVAGLELTEVMRVKGLIAPEKRSGAENLIIWIGDAASETVDAGAEPRLKFTGAAVAAGDDDSNNESGELVTKLAEDLKGKTWDADGLAWK
jgi:hypothetical protein